MPLPPQGIPREGRAAKAAYNFVPQPEKVFREDATDSEAKHDRFEPNRYSGHIPITLTTETWCYIRAAVTPGYAAAHPKMGETIWEDGSEYRDFFHHGNPEEPVVPGSEVRGMIRQLVEVMAAGRLHTGLRAKLVYRDLGGRAQSEVARGYRSHFVHDHADPSCRHGRFEYPMTSSSRPFVIKGGYLFREGRDWFIQPATAHNGETFVRVDTRTSAWSTAGWPQRANGAMNGRRGVDVWVNPAARAAHPFHGGRLVLECAVSPDPPVLVQNAQPQPPGFVRGTLVVTDKVGRRDKDFHCVIYKPCLQAGGQPVAAIAVPPVMQQQYLEDADLPRGGLKGRILAERVDDPPVNAKNGFPCFYVCRGTELVFFGGTLFFRIPYDYAPARFIPHEELDDLPRQVFGTVATGGVEAEPQVSARGLMRRGRVRFEDLLWRRASGGSSPWLETVYKGLATPLMQPKPTAVQHYLVQPHDGLDQILDYHSDPASQETVLRGFKHYWHQRGDAQDPSAVARKSTEPLEQVAALPEEKRKFRTVVRPVREGVAFEGRVYFDNLDEVELGALLSALELPGGLCHKIGMARPLGFGSVRITCDPLRVFDDRGDPPPRYRTFFLPEEEKPDADTGVLGPGWRDDWGDIRDSAKRAFAKAIVELGSEPPPGVAANQTGVPQAGPAAGRTMQQGLAKWRQRQLERGVTTPELERAFWSLPRMQELEALLSWDQPRQDSEAQAAPLTDKQWGDRKVLPPPTAVPRRS